LQLEHSFSVPVGIDEAWKILLDIERIGPCMPGAVIDSVDGDDFTGTVKVKLGPINLTYKGRASFVEKDADAHRAVIDARGRDARGNGTASALVTATLAESGGNTTVRVNTDLDITGKPAQFGRGVMVDVGNKLIGQFADALAHTIRGDGPASGPQGAESAPAGTATAALAEDAAPRKRPKPARATDSPAEPAAETPPAGQTPPAAEAPFAEPVAEALAAPESETTPAYSAPDGIPTAGGAVSSVRAVNGHHSQPRREVEPINLLESAGPAVAKRLAPVAVALVVVIAAWRRRAGKRP
jgi:carbon monoxide dehydrogenase subunit G